MGISVLAIASAASAIAIDSHPMDFGNDVALAEGGGGGQGGGGPGGDRGPGAGRGPGDQGARQGLEMQQGPMSQSGMIQRMQGQMMGRETIRSVQGRLNQLGYRAGPEDGMMGSDVTDELMARLKRQFDDDAIVELTALIAFQNMSSKFNAALAVPPQGFCSVVRTDSGEAVSYHPIDPVARGDGRRIGEASGGRMS